MSKTVPSNHDPISPEEWDAIVTAAFSPDAEPHVFSARYQKQKQKQEELLMPRITHHKRKTISIVAILAAAVVAIPTSAYAVNRLYHASVQSTGSYQKDVVIDAGDSEETDSRIQSLQVGWMPGGMTLDETSGKYHDARNRGVTMLFWKLQDDDLLQAVNRGIVHSETKTLNGNQVFFLQRDSANLPEGQTDYSNIVWIAFSNTPYAAQFYATDDLTQEELTQIAAHLSLQPAEQETAILWQPEESLIESAGDAPTSCDVSKLSYANIGDTLTKDDAVSLKLDALSTQNTFAGISTDSIGEPCDYSSYQNADGTIADNTRTWYCYGDGVNTLDEVIKTETIPQTILTFQLTYTNNGTESVETCVCPQLFRMQADGTFPAYTEETETEYHVDSSDLNITGEFFSFSSSGEHRKNNVLLQPGETQTVTVAFVVDADQLDELYLVPAPHGYELPEEVAQSPILRVASALNH